MKFKLSSEEFSKQTEESVVIICVQSGVSLTKGAGLFIFVFPVALSQVPALQMHQQAFTEQMTQE